jgi:hypothetical protein
VCATSTSTLAQLLFTASPAMNFAHVVGELDQVLSRYPAERRALSWDCDDVAIFDLDGSRIVLGYSNHLRGPHVACLTVSVGHGPRQAAPAPLAERRAALCRKITDRLTSRYPVDSIAWHETESPVTPDLIDSMIEKLPGTEPRHLPVRPAEDIDRLMARMTVELETRQTNPVTNFARPDPDTLVPLSVRPPKKTAPPKVAAAPAPVAAVPPAPADIANDRPHLPREHDENAARIRTALYPPEPEVVAAERPSTQMRLAVHAMNATMIVVVLPVGAALMTYSILRGEDMRLSGRVMALTGTFLALQNTPMAQQMMALI